MALYRLKGVSLNLERDGKRTYHKVGSIVDLTKEEVKTWAFGIEPAAAPVVDETESFLGGGQLSEDEDDGIVSLNTPDDSEILSENVPEVVEYLSEHKTDLDLLVALRDAELGGKRRKKVLDTINDLLTEGGYEED